MNTKNTYLLAAIVALGLCLGWLGTSYYQSTKDAPVNVSAVVDQAPVEIQASVEELYPHIIPPRSTLNSVLRELGVSSQIIHQIVQAAKPVADLGRLKPGTRFQLFYAGVGENTANAAVGPDSESSDIVGIKFRFSPVELLDIRRVADEWSAQKMTEAVETRIVTFAGVVKSTLWESAVAAKMDPSLIADLSDVFAWQVDFSREVQEEDRWRLSVEQKLVKGQPIGWGSILAAEYENQSQKFVGILYRTNENEYGYYSPDGVSLRRMFLKSPIRYGRISSRFNTRRLHPILQYSRPHLGVDYAAPIGTPVRAVGDGVAVDVGTRGGAGKMIRIRHNSEYATAYKHLHGFAKGIRPGARIQQGQIIGYVGNTGLSTGPHLHFEFFQGGRYVDPLGKKFPSAEPIPPEQLAQFKTEATALLTSLPDWGTDMISKSSDLRSQNAPEL